MSRYAAQTSVSANDSRSEIEKCLARYGASGFMYGWEGTQAIIGFTFSHRMVRFELSMPDRNAKEFTTTPSRGNKRSPVAAAAAFEQATKQRWRALALVVKAKLEAVESGISSFEEEFLAHIVMPNGQTMGRWAIPQIAEAYEHKRMPLALLPARGKA